MYCFFTTVPVAFYWARSDDTVYYKSYQFLGEYKISRGNVPLQMPRINTEYFVVIVIVIITGICKSIFDIILTQTVVVSQFWMKSQVFDRLD